MEVLDKHFSVICKLNIADAESYQPWPLATPEREPGV